jgi:hypothetical protein
MKDLGGTTQFTLNVEKDSELSVRNLTLTFDTPLSTSYTCTGEGDDEVCEETEEGKEVVLDKVFDD